MEARRASRSGNSSERTYQRTYKACIPCRQRKAKCDLGELPDGSPIGPPCAKCRREQRQCVFSETRAWERKKKRGKSRSRRLLKINAANDLETPEDRISPFRNTRRKPPNSAMPNDAERTIRQSEPSSPPNITEDTDGIQNNGTSPRRYTEDHHNRQPSTLDNPMMRTVVSSGQDALSILFEAATHTQETDMAERDSSDLANGEISQESPLSQMHSTVLPGTLARTNQPVELSQVSNEVLVNWEACRFVMMGWFTSREAATLIDL